MTQRRERRAWGGSALQSSTATYGRGQGVFWRNPCCSWTRTPVRGPFGHRSNRCFSSLSCTPPRSQGTVANTLMVERCRRKGAVRAPRWGLGAWGHREEHMFDGYRPTGYLKRRKRKWRRCQWLVDHHPEGWKMRVRNTPGRALMERRKQRQVHDARGWEEMSKGEQEQHDAVEGEGWGWGWGSVGIVLA